MGGGSKPIGRQQQQQQAWHRSTDLRPDEIPSMTIVAM